jgi:hypothetical protein
MQALYRVPPEQGSHHWDSVIGPDENAFQHFHITDPLNPTYITFASDTWWRQS